MKEGVYTHFEFITYLLSGLLIVVVFDVTTGTFGSEFLKNSELVADIPGFRVLMLGLVAYLVGQINFTLAHMLLQELVTVAPKFGRPSAYFLSTTQKHRDERTELERQGTSSHTLRTWFRRSFGRIQITEETHRKLRELATDGPSNNVSLEDHERILFGKAFKSAMSSDTFVKTYEKELDAFNFSRNMTMALLLCIILVLIRGIYCVGLSERCQLSADYIPMTLLFVGVCALMAWRYLYFLFSFSKHVLVHYAENESPKKSKRP